MSRSTNALLQVYAIVTAELSPSQARAAAGAIRIIQSDDDIDERFFERSAYALETLADDLTEARRMRLSPEYLASHRGGFTP